MGIFDALNTAVGGLQAQSYALQNISGNIANASTVGYKGIGTSFEDLVPQTSTPDRQVAGGVTAFAQSTITTQGTVTSSAVSTNMAINGDGFFNVQKPIGVVDNTPTFNGVTDYTRRGDFQLNSNGNLVNGAGYYLLGVPVDPKTGNPTGNVPQVLQFQNNFIPSQATSQIQYAANLPTTPSDTAASGAKAGSLVALGGLNPNDFGTNPVVAGTPAPALASGTTTGTVVKNQQSPQVAITGTTALAGAAGSNSLTASFSAGDTINVAVTSGGTTTTTVLTFVSPPTVPGPSEVSTAGTVSSLLAQIDALSGNTPATASSLSTATAFSAINVSATGSAATHAVDTSTVNLSAGLADPGSNITFTINTQLVTLHTGTGTGAGTPHAFTLSDIETAINGAGAGVTASDNGTNLILTSTATGSTASITTSGMAAAGLVAADGTFNGANAVAAASESFTVATDGGAAKTITLSAATVAAFNAAYPSNAVNASNLSAADVASLTNYQYGSNIASTSGSPAKLVFTSPTYGSASSITVGAVTTAGAASGSTGIAAGTGTAGTSPSTASNVNGGAINLQSGVTASTVTLTPGSTTTATNAFSALGFTNPMTTTRTGGGSAGTGVVTANDLTTFTSESISGGAVTAYDATGTPVNLQLRWAKVDSSALGSPHADTWNLFYQTDPNASGGQTAWINAGLNFSFNSSGTLTTPSGSSITLNNVSVGAQSLGNLQMSFGSGGLTQYASVGGSATINQIQQNGYAAGQLQSVAVNNDGIVVGTFSNGQNLDLAAVSLSHFNGTNYLKALDGAAYQATDQSGVAIAGATGTISGSSLEGSNTDIADEFTKLIVTQQAYSANTKVITTANTMIQSLMDVLR